MGRLEQLETELNDLKSAYDEAVAKNRSEDIETLSGEMDRIQSDLHTYDDNWVPETTDTDYNELG